MLIIEVNFKNGRILDRDQQYEHVPDPGDLISVQSERHVGIWADFCSHSALFVILRVIYLLDRQNQLHGLSVTVSMGMSGQANRQMSFAS